MILRKFQDVSVFRVNSLHRNFNDNYNTSGINRRSNFKTQFYICSDNIFKVGNNGMEKLILSIRLSKKCFQICRWLETSKQSTMLCNNATIFMRPFLEISHNSPLFSYVHLYMWFFYLPGFIFRNNTSTVHTFLQGKKKLLLHSLDNNRVLKVFVFLNIAHYCMSTPTCTSYIYVLHKKSPKIFLYYIFPFYFARDIHTCSGKG